MRHDHHEGEPGLDHLRIVIAGAKSVYDAISLDVDTGPRAISHPGNRRLYTNAGLTRMRRALRPGGVLAMWSSFPSRSFTEAIAVVGKVELVRTTPSFAGGPRSYIWLATKRAWNADRPTAPRGAVT